MVLSPHYQCLKGQSLRQQAPAPGRVLPCRLLRTRPTKGRGTIRSPVRSQTERHCDVAIVGAGMPLAGSKFAAADANIARFTVLIDLCSSVQLTDGLSSQRFTHKSLLACATGQTCLQVRLGFAARKLCWTLKGTSPLCLWTKPTSARGPLGQVRHLNIVF